MNSPGVLGADDPGRAAVEEGELVLVPVGVTDQWQGRGDASPAMISAGGSQKREGKKPVDGALASGSVEKDRSRKGLEVKGDEGKLGTGRKGGMKSFQKKMQKEGPATGLVCSDGAGQGGAPSTVVSPGKNLQRSPVKPKSAVNRGLPLGPGCCCGEVQPLLALEGGLGQCQAEGVSQDVGTLGAVGDSGRVPPSQVRGQQVSNVAYGSPGRGSRRSRDGPSGERRKGGNKGRGRGCEGEGSGGGAGSPGAVRGTSRERSRSPVGVRRRLEGGEVHSGVGAPVTSHGECVARIRKAVQGGEDGEGGGVSEEGVCSPSVGPTLS